MPKLMTDTQVIVTAAIKEGDWVSLDSPDFPALKGKQLLVDDVDDATAIVCLNGELTEAECHEVPLEALVIEFSAKEFQRLEVLEAVIGTGLHAFMEVGQALSEIRDSKLYRRTHETFKAYCSEVWDLEERRTYQILEASEIAQGLQEKLKNFSVFPNESQSRALKPVPDEQRPAVWQQTVAQTNGKPTAKAVEQTFFPCDADGNTIKPRAWVERCDGFGQVMKVEATENSDVWCTTGGQRLCFEGTDLRLCDAPAAVAVHVPKADPNSELSPTAIGAIDDAAASFRRASQVIRDSGLDPETLQPIPSSPSPTSAQPKRKPSTPTQRRLTAEGKPLSLGDHIAYATRPTQLLGVVNRLTDDGRVEYRPLTGRRVLYIDPEVVVHQKGIFEVPPSTLEGEPSNPEDVDTSHGKPLSVVDRPGSSLSNHFPVGTPVIDVYTPGMPFVIVGKGTTQARLWSAFEERYVGWGSLEVYQPAEGAQAPTVDGVVRARLKQCIEVLGAERVIDFLEELAPEHFEL